MSVDIPFPPSSGSSKQGKWAQGFILCRKGYLEHSVVKETSIACRIVATKMFWAGQRAALIWVFRLGDAPIAHEIFCRLTDWRPNVKIFQSGQEMMPSDCCRNSPRQQTACYTNDGQRRNENKSAHIVKNLADFLRPFLTVVLTVGTVILSAL